MEASGLDGGLVQERPVDAFDDLSTQQRLAKRNHVIGRWTRMSSVDSSQQQGQQGQQGQPQNLAPGGTSRRLSASSIGGTGGFVRRLDYSSDSDAQFARTNRPVSDRKLFKSTFRIAVVRRCFQYRGNIKQVRLALYYQDWIGTWLILLFLIKHVYLNMDVAGDVRACMVNWHSFVFGLIKAYYVI